MDASHPSARADHTFLPFSPTSAPITGEAKGTAVAVSTPDPIAGQSGGRNWSWSSFGHALSPDQETGLRRELRSIVADGIAYSVMVGIGETYLSAFALAMGMGEVASGLIATVPLMLGGL